MQVVAAMAAVAAVSNEVVQQHNEMAAQ